jgi:hypothetical protein
MPVDDEEADPELVAELYRAMEMLPAEYRDAVVLHHLEGCTIQQVADVMGSSIGTTAARLSRARAMMRERLSWRGVVMTDAMITAFVMGELFRESVPESVAARAAMVGAALVRTTTAATAAAVTVAAKGGAGVSTPAGLYGASALYGGLSVSNWIKVACAAALLGGSTAAITTWATHGETRTRVTAEASASRTNRSTAKAPLVSFESTGKVPEPSSCLGVLAVGGLLMRRHRRRNR